LLLPCATKPVTPATLRRLGARLRGGFFGRLIGCLSGLLAIPLCTSAVTAFVVAPPRGAAPVLGLAMRPVVKPVLLTIRTRLGLLTPRRQNEALALVTVLVGVILRFILAAIPPGTVHGFAGLLNGLLAER